MSCEWARQTHTDAPCRSGVHGTGLVPRTGGGGGGGQTWRPGGFREQWRVSSPPHCSTRSLSLALRKHAQLLRKHVGRCGQDFAPHVRETHEHASNPSGSHSVVNRTCPWQAWTRSASKASRAAPGLLTARPTARGRNFESAEAGGGVGGCTHRSRSPCSQSFSTSRPFCGSVSPSRVRALGLRCRVLVSGAAPVKLRGPGRAAHRRVLPACVASPCL